MNEEISRIDINNVNYKLKDEDTRALAEMGKQALIKVGYYVCRTQGSTAEKTISADDYILSTGGCIRVKMDNANTANDATLNISSTGAKALYYAGERASATNSWEDGETVEVYYDGTNYYANNVAGGSGSGDGVFDVSDKYPTSGVEGGNTYTLGGALAVLNANLSVSKKKGGMSIKFIQSSDNKYAQYRYMETVTTTATFTNANNWQEVAPKLISTEEMDDTLQDDTTYLLDGLGNVVNDVNDEPIQTSRLELTVDELNTVLTDTIPDIVEELSDIDTIRSGANKGVTAYQKPVAGIPASDLASGVIPDVSNFITASVNNLTNYYLKSETYTKAEVAALIGAIQQFHYEIYASTSEVTTPANNVLYLIGPASVSGGDKYEEYVYANNDFVKIGDTSIDLSGYATIAALNNALANYTTTTNLNTLLSGKVDKVTGKGLSTEDYTTAEKNKLAGITAGAEVNVQPDWNQSNSSADDYIKNKPTDLVGSASVRTIVLLTQAQYDALATKDANTEYNIIQSV